MKPGRRVRSIGVLAVAILAIAAAFVLRDRFQGNEQLVAGGLRNPRAAVVLPDNAIIVTEAGLPDTTGTTDKSTRQVTSGRLSWVRDNGEGRRTLLDNLPGQYVGLLNEVIGPAGIAPAPNGGLYVLIGQCAQARCSALHLLGSDGKLTQLVDLRGFAVVNPAVTEGGAPNEESNPWGIAVGPDGVVFISDAAANDVVRIDPNVSPPRVSVHVRLPEQAVPTGIALADDGALYVAIFTALKHPTGSGSIARISPDGRVTTAVDGLTMPIGVFVEPNGALLVLEFSDNYSMDTGYRARSGKLSRIDPNASSTRHTLSTKLTFPTSIARASDGRAYVTTGGAFTGNARSANGEIVRIRRLESERPWWSFP